VSLPRGARGAPADAASNEPIYIVLPVHNRRDHTERFIQALKEQSDQVFHLVVVDDGSTDGTNDMVRTAMPEATVLRSDGNLWWAGGLQRGVDWLLRQPVTGDGLVLLVNDDTMFETDFLGNARDALENTARTMLHAQLCDEHGCVVGVSVDWRRLIFRDVMDPGHIDCVSTRGLFLRLRDFRELGGFHPRLLPHYLSDYEFTLRARRSGYRFISDPQVRIKHAESEHAQLRAKGLRDHLRGALSKRSPDNPIYWSAFLLLACPRRYLPFNVARVWVRFLRVSFGASHLQMRRSDNRGEHRGVNAGR
jgi:GT2 family glycosyltransferase